MAVHILRSGDSRECVIALAGIKFTTFEVATDAALHTTTVINGYLIVYSSVEYRK